MKTTCTEKKILLACKQGKIQITRNGLLSQDFITTNGRARVETLRIGGGFMKGYNLYKVTIDGQESTQTDLHKVFKLVLGVLG